MILCILRGQRYVFHTFALILRLLIPWHVLIWRVILILLPLVLLSVLNLTIGIAVSALQESTFSIFCAFYYLNGFRLVLPHQFIVLG